MGIKTLTKLVGIGFIGVGIAGFAGMGLESIHWKKLKNHSDRLRALEAQVKALQMQEDIRKKAEEEVEE